jgi:uncharacterized protein (DUF362 family)
MSLDHSEIVSIVRFDGRLDSLKKAADLCAGFKDLKRNASVLIKPNICAGKNQSIPPFGVVTTSLFLDLLIQILKDYGLQQITIGEGSIITYMSNTASAFSYAGIDRLSKTYGVKLIDLNKGPFQSISAHGFDFEVAKAILEANFVINVAVLKNHFQTKVSLCMKNLKGCLSPKSKKDCHKWNLETSIAIYNTMIPVHMNFIDGIYSLINGPWVDSGVPIRSNLIIASRDRLKCDIVGSAILGADPDQVAHLNTFGRMQSRSTLLSEIETKGEDLNEVKVAQQYKDEDLFREVFKKARIKGISFSHPGKSLCSGCFGNIMVALLLFCQDNQGIEVENIEFIAGNERRSSRHCKVAFLYGDCAVKNNQDSTEINERVLLKGCPPTFIKTYSTILRTLLREDEANRQLLELVSLKSREKAFTLFDDLKPPDFDRKHFS